MNPSQQILVIWQYQVDQTIIKNLNTCCLLEPEEHPDELSWSAVILNIQVVGYGYIIKTNSCCHDMVTVYTVDTMA